jgi:putative oxidoreductase
MANTNSGWSSFLALIGRICFSAIFILASISKITTFNVTLAAMTKMGVPYAEYVLVLAILFELAGGLLVLLGWYTRFGAFLLLLFIIPVSYFMHPYWQMQGADMMMNWQQFMKNISLIGGCLYIIAYGAGKMSLDGLIRKKC